MELDERALGHLDHLLARADLLIAWVRLDPGLKPLDEPSDLITGQMPLIARGRVSDAEADHEPRLVCFDLPNESPEERDSLEIVGFGDRTRMVSSPPSEAALGSIRRSAWGRSVGASAVRAAAAETECWD